MLRLFMIAVLVAAPVLLGQSSSGTLTGRITDPSQASLPNVALKLKQAQTGVVLTATTTTSGEYTFPLLASGTYQLEAEAGGFQRSTRTGIVIELGRVVRIDIAMRLGQVSDSVEVSGAPPLIESESATVGQFIENKTIADMPPQRAPRG